MSFIFRFFWVVRAVLFKPFFRRLSMPSYMGSPKFLMGCRRISVSRRVRIFPGLRAECHGDGELVIHENVAIGHDFHVVCGGRIDIGRGCLISGNVFLTDMDHRYDDVARPVFDQGCIIRNTKIGENCFIGIGARIQAGTTLGKGCVVGANSVVRGDFPDHSVIVGSPGRIVKKYDPESREWVRC